MMKRAFYIVAAMACLALLPFAVQGQAVIVDNGVAAEDYTATGPAAGVTTGVAGVTITGATTISDGNTLHVGGLTTLAGGANITGAVTGTGVGTFDSLVVNNNAAVGGNLGVTGTTTLTGAVTANGGATVHSGASLFSGNGAATDNKVVVNGAGASIGSQFSGLAVNSVTNAVSLISDTNGAPGDARAALSMTPTSASLLVNTNTGVAHGLVVSQTNTVLSGGTNSTTLTLDDTGATFHDTVTNGPARVHGVANGIAPFDAVNVRQLERGITSMSSGIASVAALAAIPGPVGCKNYSFGVGYGHYSNENAGAVGFKANLPKSNISLAAGVGFSQNSSPAYDAGASFSF